MDPEPPALLDGTSPAPSPLPPEEKAGKIYHAGSLRYTLRGLLVLSVWLLWGDFAFTFFENVFGRFLPLYLKDLNASNTLIGVMTGSIAGAVNILFLPNISQWSDHYRGRLGRRIPFLYVVTPLTVAALVAVGFAPAIAGWVQTRILVHFAPAVSASALVLGLLCAMVVCYHFFNMVLVNAYNWLVRDVVPQELMARFLSWFRIIGTASSFAFLWWVFPHLKDDRETIFLLVGIFYLAGFLLMCLNVKEGEYPPPPSKENRPGLVKSFALYFQDCLCLPIYRHFYAASVLVVLALGCAGSFFMLFTRDTLNLDMGTIGKIFAWGTMASTLIYFPMGWLCDRFNPFRVILVGLAGLTAASLLGFFATHDRESFLIWTLATTLPSAAWALGSMAATMKLFPKQRFGQFYSALNIFGCGILIPGNYLIGKLMDLTHSNYRVVFLWSAVLYAAALYPMTRVYREWKKHGGPDHYAPPLPPRDQPA